LVDRIHLGSLVASLNLRKILAIAGQHLWMGSGKLIEEPLRKRERAFQFLAPNDGPTVLQ
jgi:hypothetical protein